MTVYTPFGDAIYLGLCEISPKGYIFLIDEGWQLYVHKEQTNG